MGEPGWKVGGEMAGSKREVQNANFRLKTRTKGNAKELRS